MNRTERRAAERCKKKKKISNETFSIPVRKSRDIAYIVLGVIGCLLSLLWAYTEQSWLSYMFFGILLLYTLNFSVRIYQNCKKK